jgi:hypothetical protein
MNNKKRLKMKSYSNKFNAYWRGKFTYATRERGKWFVAGDVAPSDDGVQVLLATDGRPAWYTLRGNRLVFDDCSGLSDAFFTDKSLMAMKADEAENER